MARSRKSHDADEEDVKTPGKLARAYSGKAGGNRYVVYAHFPKDGVVTRALVWSLNQLYAAKWFVHAIIGPQGEYEERENFGSRAAIVTGDGVIISMYGDLLKQVLEYEPTPAESEWRDPFAYKLAMSLKYGKADEGRNTYGPADVDAETTTDRDEPDNQDSERTPRGRKGRSGLGRRGDGLDGPRTKSPRAPKPEGLVTAGELATELGVEAREVRGVLRSLKLEKPAHGWAWSKEEAESLKVQIKKGLKK